MLSYEQIVDAYPTPADPTPNDQTENS